MKGKIAVLVSCVMALALVAYSALAFAPWEDFSVRTKPVEKARLLQGEDDPEQSRAQLLPGDSVDINSADEELLELLPGVGPDIAGEIIRYRQENGDFESIEDIMNVEGIGQGRYEGMAEWINTGEADENTGR